eukprot:TRINITY_DN3120_c0_g1_i3.p3 TRINITY_DN3120_c0_g1~~TRINITY_DN3120_c0_g1_i3.p3  ORF type:complete len:110 (+),score=23.66 TRINITY_DN3120_c0_g1_i3:51-332(+)
MNEHSLLEGNRSDGLSKRIDTRVTKTYEVHSLKCSTFFGRCLPKTGLRNEWILQYTEGIEYIGTTFIRCDRSSPFFNRNRVSLFQTFFKSTSL